jgi:hypothetical protein
MAAISRFLLCSWKLQVEDCRSVPGRLESLVCFVVVLSVWMFAGSACVLQRFEAGSWLPLAILLCRWPTRHLVRRAIVGSVAARCLHTLVRPGAVVSSPSRWVVEGAAAPVLNKRGTHHLAPLAYSCPCCLVDYSRADTSCFCFGCRGSPSRRATLQVGWTSAWTPGAWGCCCCSSSLQPHPHPHPRPRRQPANTVVSLDRLWAMPTA